APFMGFENPDDLFFCISFFHVVAPSLFYATNISPGTIFGVQVIFITQNPHLVNHKNLQQSQQR
ncbi:MAG: hypothetical protein ACOYKD_03005, partial [Anaerolineaceae bacterium]